jgi:hypothetical protein
MLQQDADELYDRLVVDVSDDAALELQHVQVVVDAVVMLAVVPLLLLILMRGAVVLGLCLSSG